MTNDYSIVLDVLLHGEYCAPNVTVEQTITRFNTMSMAVCLPEKRRFNQPTLAAFLQ